MGSAALVKHEEVFGLPGHASALGLALEAHIPFDRWLAAGPLLGRIAGGIQYWVVDWLCYGEEHYGEKAAQGVAALGISEATLLNWVWVYKAVPRSRRREGLSHTHYALVAPLDPERQVQLLEAASHGDLLPAGGRKPWSSRRLREEIRKGGERHQPDGYRSASVQNVIAGGGASGPEHAEPCDGLKHHLPREEWTCEHRFPGPPTILRMAHHCPTCTCMENA